LCYFRARLDSRFLDGFGSDLFGGFIHECLVPLFLVISEGPIRRTREGGSEWEPIKILLEGDGNSYKMNTASNTRLRLTTKVGQAHVATRVPLDLGTNTHTLPTRERSATPNLESTDPHRSDR
jgi:hypothetical protein